MLASASPHMEHINQQFGLLIAYVLPGFVGLGGVALIVPSVARWLQPFGFEGLSGIGPPVYAVLSAITVGMIISCIRWLVIDHVMHGIGVQAPRWSPSQLETHLSSFTYLVESHYRYYQFYANSVVALVWTYAIYRAMSAAPWLGSASDIAIITLCGVLLLGARDALAKYYRRTAQLVGE